MGRVYLLFWYLRFSLFGRQAGRENPQATAGYRGLSRRSSSLALHLKGFPFGAPNAFLEFMNAHIELKPCVVLDASETDRATCHPTQRSLSRYASNEMGSRRKKVVLQHLDICEDCRKNVVRYHALARTFRDWERSAIELAGQAGQRQLTY
jgi:hypothetical protein